MARRVVQDEGCLEECTQADDLPKEEPEDQREPQAQEVEVMLLSVINVFSTALDMSHSKKSSIHMSYNPIHDEFVREAKILLSEGNAVIDEIDTYLE